MIGQASEELRHGKIVVKYDIRASKLRFRVLEQPIEK